MGILRDDDVVVGGGLCLPWRGQLYRSGDSVLRTCASLSLSRGIVH